MIIIVSELHVASDKILDIRLDNNQIKLVEKQITLKTYIEALKLSPVAIFVSVNLETTNQDYFREIHQEENGDRTKVIKHGV